MPTITGKAIAILSKYNNLDKDGMPNNIDDPYYVRVNENGDYSFWTKDGYTIIGEAEITINVFDKKQIVKNKVAALRIEVSKIRADSQMAVTRIESQINDLLAIGYAPNEDGIPF